jgi:hypothetical protein
MLSKDGKLKLKIFNRYNQNVVVSDINNNNNMITGASILHTQNFSTLKELLSFKKKKKKRLQLATPEEEATTQSKPGDSTTGNSNQAIPPSEKK